MNRAPNQSRERAGTKNMLNFFILITKTTLLTSIPVSFSQIIFGEDHLPLDKPHKNLNL